MRPQKRQRRVILDSDDDEEDTASQALTTCNLTAKAPEPSKPRNHTQRPTRSSSSTTQKKAKSGSLHTFFNARTQAQRAGSISSSRATSPVRQDEEDLEDIEEDVEDVETTSLRSKRKFTPIPSRVKEESPPQKKELASRERLQPGINTGNLGSLPSPNAPSVQSRPWVDLFPPLGTDELAVHKKKVAEVDEWLRTASAGNAYRRLLVLKGPAGSGKTATVLTLAKSRGLQVLEWNNPSSSTYGDEDYQSASAQFDEFIGGSAPFTSLAFDDADVDSQAETNLTASVRDRITLIEEVHVIARWSTALLRFRETVMVHLSSPVPYPVVVILSEEDNSFSNMADTLTAQQLLGPEILQHPAVAVIEFNPVAPTFVSKAIDLVIKKEARLSRRRRIPGPSVLRALAETGDIRSAIGMLEMMCLNENDTALSGRVAGKGSKTAKAKTALTETEQATLNAISQRESHLGLFHAVGKVVYNKREQPSRYQPPPFLAPHARPLSSIVDVDELFGSTATDVDTFVAALHENYAPSCEADDPLEHLDACLQNLSHADVMANLGSTRMQRLTRRSNQGSSAIDGLRHDEMVFNTAVRGLLFALPFPVKRKAKGSGWHGDPYKMQYPDSVRLGRHITEAMEVLSGYRMQDAVQGMSFTASGQRKPARSGVEAWASSWSPYALPQQPKDQVSESGPSRAMVGLSRMELVTLQLPYLAKMSTNGIRSGKLGELVRFSTLAVPDVRNSLKTNQGRMSQEQRGTGDGRKDSDEFDGLESLVLSEDDIEDD